MKEEIQAMFEHYPNFKECSLQTFNDEKNGEKSKYAELARIFENKEENYIRLDQLSEKGAGVFFSVNSMQPGQRKQENVTKVNARICECDDTSKETQMKIINNCPVRPTMIIESKKSYHMYRFSKDGTIEKRDKICNGLRNFFDGDPKIIDIARVLRLPGYPHQKDPENKYITKIVEYNGEYYTEKQMLESYGDTRSVSERKQELIRKENETKKGFDDDYFRDRVKSMDSRRVLEALSGNKLVNNEVFTFLKNSGGTEQIVVNGRETGKRIDKQGKIGGVGHRTNRVFRYGNCDGKELYRRIKETFPEMCESKKIEKKEKIEIVDFKDDIDFNSITPYSRGLQSLDNRFGRFDKNKLIVTIGESQSGKTEFTFFQARENAKKGVNCCYIALEMSKKQMIIRMCMKSAKVSKQERDNKTMPEGKKILMRKKYDELRNYKNLDIVSIKEPTIENIKQIIQEKMNEGNELFYIDNLGFIQANKSEIEHTAEVIRELKNITNEYPISINLLHHFNKGNSKDRIGPRGMESIRSSGKIENDADYVLQVWRDLDPNLPLEAKANVSIFLQKDRTRGDPSECEIRFDCGDYIEV